jgi:hypothetical protein
MAKAEIYGLMAEFEDSDALLAAAKAAHKEGYQDLDTYSPFPMEEIAEAIHFHKTGVPPIVLIGGLCGAATGFLLQNIGSMFDYPLNVGGRPLFSWPSFIPITFESGVLFAAFSAVLGMLALNGLPQPYHPVFNVPGFERATDDRFFLCIEATDPKFGQNTRSFLQGLRPKRITEVEY